LTLDWLFIGTIIVVGAGMAALPIALNTIIAPRKPNKTKSETYECGIEIGGDAWVQSSFHDNRWLPAHNDIFPLKIYSLELDRARQLVFPPVSINRCARSGICHSSGN